MEEQKGKARFRIPVYIGGLNEALRADLIKDGEFAELTNFYVTKDGEVKRRADFDSLSEPILAPIYHTIKKVWVWKTSFFPTGADETKNYVMVVYSEGKELWLLHFDGSGWVSSILKETNEHPVFVDLEEPRIAQTTIGLAIVDGRDSHLAKTIEIRPDRKIIYGDIGLPPPLSMPEMSIEPADNNYVPMTSLDPGMAVQRGSILFLAYTMVTDDGLESNPSPLCISTILQFLKKDDDAMLEEFWQRTVFDRLRTILADATLPGSQALQIKYFNVYMASCLYTEGVLGFTDLHLAARMLVTDLTGDNRYVSTSPFAGHAISYENDQSCKGDDICFTGGILFVSNANVAIRFSFDFAYYFRISISNKNSRHYVDAAVWIRLKEEDLVDAEGYQIIDWAGLTTGNSIMSSVKHLLRFYDADLTTLLPAAYKYTPGNDYVDVLIRIPYLPGYSAKDIYFCYGGVGVPLASGEQTDFRTPEYGDWCNISTSGEWDNQKVLFPLRVRNNFEELVVSCDLFKEWNKAPNRANLRHFLRFDVYAGGGSGTLQWVDDNVLQTHPFVRVLGQDTYLPYYSENNEKTIEIANGFRYAYHEEGINLPFPQSGYVMFDFRSASTDYAGVTSYPIFSIQKDADNFLRLFRKQNETQQIYFLGYRKTGNPTYNMTQQVILPYANQPVKIFFSWSVSENKIILAIFTMTDVYYIENDLTLAFQYFPSEEVSPYHYSIANGTTGIYVEPVYFSQIRAARDQFIDNLDLAKKMLDHHPYFPEENVGFDEDSGENLNVKIHEGKEVTYDTRIGMIKFSSVGGRTFPDLNYLFAKGRVVRIIPAPSYLRDGNYLNCVVVFGEDFRQRILLAGEPGNWQARVHELLIDEKLHFGLSESCKETLLMVAESLYWLSGDKFLKENAEGLKFLNYEGGIEKIKIPYTTTREHKAFYNAIDNQIIIYAGEPMPPDPDPTPAPEPALTIPISGHCVSGLDTRIVHGTNIFAWGWVEYWRQTHPDEVFSTRSFIPFLTDTNADWNEGDLNNVEPVFNELRLAASLPAEYFTNTNMGKTGTIQTYTITVSGTYFIVARGAQGGTGLRTGTGGKGALVSGNFELLAGDEIKILVGQMGTNNENRVSGGGATFVVRERAGEDPLLLLVAGGGGGYGVGTSLTYEDIPHGNDHPDGKTGYGGTSNGVGGQDGEGGGNATNRAAGGGGYLTNGANANTANSGGKSYLNGGEGGDGNGHADGGFGGGGAVDNTTGWGASAGGGGYSGGGGGYSSSDTDEAAGGGGGSYNSGDNPITIAAVNEGHGECTILLAEYEAEGYRISPAIPISGNTLFMRFEIDAYIPAGTSASVQISFDDGVTWHSIINNGHLFPIPPGTTAYKTRQVLTTNNNTITPSISSILIKLYDFGYDETTRFHTDFLYNLATNSIYCYRVLAVSPGGQFKSIFGCCFSTGQEVYIDIPPFKNPIFFNWIILITDLSLELDKLSGSIAVSPSESRSRTIDRMVLDTETFGVTEVNLETNTIKISVQEV